VKFNRNYDLQTHSEAIDAYLWPQNGLEGHIVEYNCMS